jgi:hypothetical protein
VDKFLTAVLVIGLLVDPALAFDIRSNRNGMPRRKTAWSDDFAKWYARVRRVGARLKAGTSRGRLMNARRFPPPWTIDDNGACFIVKDNNGQALAYVYYENEPGRRAAANLLTSDEARRIAANIAKIPEYRRGGQCEADLTGAKSCTCVVCPA